MSVPQISLHPGQAIDALLRVSEAKWEADEYGACRLMAKIDGKWMHVCRTDLMDDVCTYGVVTQRTADEAVRAYADRVMYGARIDDDRFAVIDSFSDG